MKPSIPDYALCHTERSEVSRHVSAELSNRFFVSIRMTEDYSSQRSALNFCHTERSEVSRHVSAELSNRFFVSLRMTECLSY